MTANSDNRRLIVNADGYGFTPGLNRGIDEAIGGGIVKSVSCNVNFPYIEEVGDFAARHPHVSVGIHFNLSVGKPVSDPSSVRTLVDEDGRFWGGRLPRRLIRGEVDGAEIRRELDAQARRLTGLGVRISHWDGHQNQHLYPRYFTGALDVARKHGIQRMRAPNRYLVPEGRQVSRLKELGRYYAQHPNRFVTHSYGRILSRIARRSGMKTADRLISPAYLGANIKATQATWDYIVDTLPGGTNEIYCHPGYVDDVLREHAQYLDERELEIEVLTSPALRDRVAAAGVTLCSFWDV